MSFKDASYLQMVALGQIEALESSLKDEWTGFWEKAKEASYKAEMTLVYDMFHVKHPAYFLKFRDLLEKNRFKVRICGDLRLHVSWDPQDIGKLQLTE